MAPVVLAVNPVLAGFGQFAAIVICFYILVFVIITVAFNLAMVFGLSFLRQKAELIKKLRPTIESVNQTTHAAVQGTPPPEDANAIVRIVATVPTTMNNVDGQVEKATERVAEGVIEFRARTEQVQTVVTSFIRSFRRRPEEPKQLPAPLADQRGLEFKSPGYRILMEERPEAVPGGTLQSNEERDALALNNGRTEAERLSNYNDVPAR